MKTIPALLATLLLASLTPASFAEEAPETKVKETDWVTITVPKTVAADAKVTAKIKIKGSAIKEDCELWANLSKFVGTTRKHNIERIEPKKLTAGADVEHEATFKVPADAAGVVVSVFTMPSGKTDWSDKLLATEVGVQVK